MLATYHYWQFPKSDSEFISDIINLPDHLAYQWGTVCPPSQSTVLGIYLKVLRRRIIPQRLPNNNTLETNPQLLEREINFFPLYLHFPILEFHWRKVIRDSFEPFFVYEVERLDVVGCSHLELVGRSSEFDSVESDVLRLLILHSEL